MTTTFEQTRNNITSRITMRDCAFYIGDVVIEETINNRFCYQARLAPEHATNYAYELLGTGWRVVKHSI